MAHKRIKKHNWANRRTRTNRTRWLAVGTLAAYAAWGAAKPALAGQAMRESEKVVRESLPVRRFDISGGSLGDVLKTYQLLTGLTVRTSSDGLLTVYSPGVQGSYSDDEALSRLLANTGLQARVESPGQLLIELKRSIMSVDVTGSAPVLTSSLPKYQIPLVDTPQTISVVPQQVMQQQGTTTLRDAVRNVAGISLSAGEGGAQGDNLTVRGFSARNDLFIDGMRDFGSYYRDPFNTQEVQVLQGPTSVTFGRGSTGGVVNQASKSPNLNQFMEAGLQFGTDATRRATIDVNIPLPKLGPGAAFRLAGMGTLANVAERDVATLRRDGIAPSLALGLGTPTRVVFSYFHQNADDIPDYGVPWLFNGPAPVPRDNYYGLAEGNFLRTYDDIGTAKVEHDFNSNLTIRDQFRYANYARRALISEAQTTGVKFGTPLDEITVNRNEIAVASDETNLDNQLDVVAHFHTGPIRHAFVSGAEGARETSDPTRPRWTAPRTSLLFPDPSQSLNPGVTIASRVTDTAVTGSVYALDTVNLGSKVMLTGGVRFDRFDNTYRQFVAPAASFNRVDQKPTWRTALVYKPVAAGSLYVAAGTSFNPSAESLALSAGSANVAPESNKNYEVGTKWELGQGRLTANAAVFRTTKENAREADPTNALLVVLAGNQRVSGTQIDVRGRVNRHWELLAGYAYLDSKVVSSRFYPLSVGYPLANSPRHTFNYWSTHHLPYRFDFGVGTNYVSSRTASSTAPLDPTTGLLKQVPGYWVFNAMVARPLGEHLNIQANIYNLANRYYYDQLHPAHLVIGAGRSALIGFNFKF